MGEGAERSEADEVLALVCRISPSGILYRDTSSVILRMTPSPAGEGLNYIIHSERGNDGRKRVSLMEKFKEFQPFLFTDSRGRLSLRFEFAVETFRVIFVFA